MIKAVLFDLDGVLVDADKWHFNALNVALQHADVEPISWQEHLTIYKGIPTMKKLAILIERKGLSRALREKIHRAKQDVTVEIIARFCEPDPEKVEMLNLLRRRYAIGVCSNSMRATVELMLERSGLLQYVDFHLSNQDVTTPKPSPEIYQRACERLGFLPEECVIVEDSEVGKKSAADSGGLLCSVSGPAEVNYYRVLAAILDADRINIVIPAAGQGKRFAEAGYQHPKPLIDVLGKPMLGWVLENMAAIGRPIIILQGGMVERYRAETVLRCHDPAATIVTIDGLTEGAACTVLAARDLIDNNNELLVVNSDQYVDLDVEDWIEAMRAREADGGILTFQSDHPKWSYAKCDDTGRVLRVAEKVVISDHATVGMYYFRRGRDFVAMAERMIRRNIRHNGEFYVCPVYNELIEAGGRIFIHEIERERMHGLGTPEDLRTFIAAKRAALGRPEWKRLVVEAPDGSVL